MLVETTIRKPTMGFSQLQKYGRDLHLDLHLGYIYVHHISSAIPYNTSASFSKKKKNHNSFFFFFGFSLLLSIAKPKNGWGLIVKLTRSERKENSGSSPVEKKIRRDH